MGLLNDTLDHLWEAEGWIPAGHPPQFVLKGASSGCGCCAEYFDEDEIEFRDILNYIQRLEDKVKNAKDLKRKYFTKNGERRVKKNA